MSYALCTYDRVWAFYWILDIENVSLATTNARNLVKTSSILSCTTREKSLSNKLQSLNSVTIGHDYALRFVVVRILDLGKNSIWMWEDWKKREKRFPFVWLLGIYINLKYCSKNSSNLCIAHMRNAGMCPYWDLENLHKIHGMQNVFSDFCDTICEYTG